MKLSAPKQMTWWVAVVVGALGFIGNFVTLPVISGPFLLVTFYWFCPARPGNLHGRALNRFFAGWYV